MDSSSEQHKTTYNVQQALHDRLNAYTEGACFALDNMSFENNTEKNTLQASLRTALNEEIESLSQRSISTKEYYDIVGYFIERLATLSHPHLNIKDISLGSAYWAWQHHQRQDIISDVTVDTITMHIVETVVVPKMTETNKVVFRTIRDQNPPNWFTQLRPWEQTYLKKITPQDLSDAADWSAFEKVLPSTLRRFPGLANATKKTTVTTDSKGHTSTKISYRQGIPSTFDMPSPDYLESAKYNLQQLLDATQTDIQQNFHDFWGLPTDSKIMPPVVLLGLLTHRKDANIFGISGSYLGFGGKEDNTKRTDEKTQVITEVANQYPGLQLIDLNIGVNWFRGHFLGARIDQYIETMESFLQNNQAALTNGSVEAKQKWDHANSTLADLKTHQDKNLISGRNKNLFTAALCHYLVNQTGGCAIPNCKSAKDRTAQELIMADAIELYYHRYQKLPQYDDMPSNRNHFIAIFVEIYKTRHHHKVANDNSPGSMGIKDEHMLDQDIVAALNADPLDARHTESKHLAKLNKSELSTLYKAFQAVMNFGMMLKCQLVELWQFICIAATKIYNFGSQNSAADTKPVYNPIQDEKDVKDDPDNPHIDEPRSPFNYQ